MSTNVKLSAKYQLNEMRKAIIIFYGALLAVHIIFGGVSFSYQGRYGMVVNSNGMDMVSAIFLFVMGLCAFKENFGMLLQNGFSRRSVFWGRMASFGLVAAGMMLLDQLLMLLLNGMGRLLIPGGYTVSPLSAMLYGRTGVQGVLVSMAFALGVYLCVLALGYCISLMFYRLPTAGKVAVGVGAPVLLTMVLPTVDLLLFDGRISAAIGTFFAYAMGLPQNQPWLGVLSLLVLAAVLCGLAWLMLRRATVKK